MNRMPANAVTPEFHFDFGSPNAYLAHRVIPGIEARTGTRFRYVPVLLGGVFKATGNRSPGEAFAGIRNQLDYPYVLAEDCRLKPIREWGLRHSRVSALAERQRAYAEQVRCVTRKVGEAVTAVEQSPGGRRTIIVVHGDHGSRLTAFDPTIEALDRFSEADVIASHATLFAVRADGIAGGLDDRRLPVWRLVKSLADSEFRSTDVDLPNGFVPNVMLVHKDAEPVRPYPLPDFRTAN